MRLAGKHGIVTGAGQGIGRAIALAYAAEGAQVLALSRTTAKLLDLPALGASIRIAALDVCDPEAGRRLSEERADILVNCAGLVVAGAVIGSRDADWEESWRVNVRAPMRLTRAVLPPSLEDRIACTADPQAAVFLASDAAAFMTGQLLVIDGGQTP